jgi:signal recognition particle subunit SRP54
MHQEMATMMKKMKKMGGLSKLGALFGKGLGGGAPGAGDLDALMGGAGLPPGGLPGMPGGNPQGLPPGFQNFLKKR